MKETRFGDLFTFIRNGLSIKQDKSGDGLPITRIETIAAGKIDPSRVGYAGVQVEDCGNWLLEPGDILFSHINSVEHIGKCAVYRGTPNPLVHGMNLLCLRPRKDLLDSNYAQWLLRNSDFRSRLANFINKAVNQASVSITNLRSIRVTVPPLEEQRRIAAILDQAEALRAKRRQALAKLDTLTQSLFLDMFGNFDAIPVTNSRPLQEIIAADRPICYGILMPGEAQVSGVSYVRVVDMKDGGIDLTNVRKTTSAISDQYRRSLLKGGDLLLSIRGHVGRLAEVPSELEGANITQDTARLAIDGAVPRFVRELLRSIPYQRWMKRHTKGVAVRGINLGDLKVMPIYLPELKQQKRIEDESNKIDALRTKARIAIEHSELLFSSLQHRAFRGEL